jgi:hypothetical protein
MPLRISRTRFVPGRVEKGQFRVRFPKEREIAHAEQWKPHLAEDTVLESANRVA